MDTDIEDSSVRSKSVKSDYTKSEYIESEYIKSEYTDDESSIYPLSYTPYPGSESIVSYSSKNYPKHNTKIDPNSKHLTLEQSLDCIRSKVNDLIGDKKIPGIALGIIINNKVVLSEGYGVRNSKNDPVTSETIYQLGEVSEVLSTVYHARDVSLKRSKFNEKVNLDILSTNAKCYATYIDIYSHRIGYQQIDIGQTKFLSKGSYNTIKDSFKSEELNKDNGNFRSLYSHQSVLFNMAIEKLLLKYDSNINTAPLETFVKFINMNNTKWGKMSYLNNNNKASSMQKCDKIRHPFTSNFIYDTDQLILSLGASSNIEDLLQFLKLLLNYGECDGKLLIDPDVMSEMLTSYIRYGEDTFSSLGWTVVYRFGTKLYWKSAVIPTGQRAIVIFSLEKSFGFVSLSSCVTSYPEAIFALAWNLLISNDICEAYKQYDKYQCLYGKRIKGILCSPIISNTSKPKNLKKNKIPKLIDASFTNSIHGKIKFYVNETDEQLIQIGDTDPVKARPYENNTWMIRWINRFGISELSMLSICFNYSGHPIKIIAYIHCQEIIYNILINNNDRLGRKYGNSGYNNSKYNNPNCNNSKCNKSKYSKFEHSNSIHLHPPDMFGSGSESDLELSSNSESM